MKNILMISLIFALGLSFTGCEDNKDEYLGDYSTILYFKESGELPITLYKTGEDWDYQLVVNKAGSNLTSVTDVGVKVLKDNALAEYNTEHGTQYVKLPENYYQIIDNRLDFSSGDLYKMVNIVFKTDLIYELPADVKYVLPVSLSESKDSINSEKNSTLLIPSVMIPSIYFNQTGFVSNTFTDEGEAQATFTLPVTMPMQNKWTFDCTIEVDKALLEAYNEKNGTTYTLLPENAYTLSGDGKLSFTPEFSLKELEINVEREKLIYGDYVLPLRLTNCTQEGFVIDTEKNACLYGISYVPDKNKMKDVALTVNMLSSNAVEPSEGSLANLLDGDVETYFHSAWSVAVEGAHYLQVALPTESSALSFSYTTRSANGSAAPAEIIVEGSIDGVSFNRIRTLSSGLPTGGKETYESQIMVGESFKFVRFVVTKNATGGDYFVWSEFRMKTY